MWTISISSIAAKLFLAPGNPVTLILEKVLKTKTSKGNTKVNTKGNTHLFIQFRNQELGADDLEKYIE